MTSWWTSSIWFPPVNKWLLIVTTPVRCYRESTVNSHMDLQISLSLERFDSVMYFNHWLKENTHKFSEVNALIELESSTQPFAQLQRYLLWLEWMSQIISCVFSCNYVCFVLDHFDHGAFFLSERDSNIVCIPLWSNIKATEPSEI